MNKIKRNCALKYSYEVFKSQVVMGCLFVTFYSFFDTKFLSPFLVEKINTKISVDKKKYGGLKGRFVM